MSVDEAEIWLRQVVKGGLADKETIKAIEVILRSYNAILTNYNALEEDMDKLQEEMTAKEYAKIVTSECEKNDYCHSCKFNDEDNQCVASRDVYGAINIAKEIKEGK